MTSVTRILSKIDQGDPKASRELLPLVYDELRKLAAAKLADEKAGQTLQPTALVHEAFMRLVEVDKLHGWKSRGHFFGAAAEAMRRILIDNARRKQRAKHGGDWNRIDLNHALAMTDDRAEELLTLDQALEKLAAEAPTKAELVKLRYFAGLSHQDAAQSLGISRATADRYWAYAKAFLHCEMEAAENS